MGHRMLSFTESDLLWQCSETAAYEDEPDVEANLSEEVTKKPFWVLKQHAIPSRDGWDREYCPLIINVQYRWLSFLGGLL